MLKVQYRMHPAIRTFPSAFFYSNELIDADSVLLREDPWYLDTPAAAGAAAAAAAAVGDASIPANPADPRKRRSPTPDPSAASVASALLGGDGGRSSNGSSSSSSSSSSSFLLPYGVFDVSRGVEHSVGRSKANAAEAQLAVELYCQLRPALIVRGMAAAAEAAAKQELLLALPTDVSVLAVYCVMVSRIYSLCASSGAACLPSNSPKIHPLLLLLVQQLTACSWCFCHVRALAQNPGWYCDPLPWSARPHSRQAR
jgi:hypothetical protein